MVGGGVGVEEWLEGEGGSGEMDGGEGGGRFGVGGWLEWRNSGSGGMVGVEEG